MAEAIEPAALAPPGRLGTRRRLRSGPAARARQLLVLAVTAVAGFLVVGQLRGPAPAAPPLESQREGDLARILASLTTEADSLREEIGSLKLQLLSIQNATQRDDAAVAAATEQLRALEVLAGTVPATGQGVVVTIADPNRQVNYAVLLDLIQELRDAGAEAIALNGHRVGATSALASREGAVTIDGVAVRPPYRIAAIGQPATLDGGLKIPGGAVDTVSALRGAAVDVARQARVDVPALAAPPSFRVGHPVGSEP